MDYEEYSTPSPDPVIISQLWAEWVCVVCGWKNIPTPTQYEWTKLKSRFYIDKAPVDSVEELMIMRDKSKKESS